MDIPRVLHNTVTKAFEAVKAPFSEGKRHLRIALTRSEATIQALAKQTNFYPQSTMPTPLQRVLHASLGVALYIPIVNLIVYIACKIFGSRHAAEPTVGAVISALLADPSDSNVRHFIDTASEVAWQVALQQHPVLFLDFLHKTHSACTWDAFLDRAKTADITAFFTATRPANGDTLLHLAIKHHHYTCVKLLLEKATTQLPAMLGAKDHKGRIPLSYALYTENASIIKLLLDCIAVHPEMHHTLAVTENNGDTILHCAVRNPNALGMIINSEHKDMFIRLTMPLCIANLAGRTPLHCALLTDEDTDVLPLIITLFEHWPAQSRAMQLVRDRDGRTPLHWAIVREHKYVARMHKQMHVLEFLINNLPPMDLHEFFSAVDIHNSNFMHYAAFCNNYRVAKLVKQHAGEAMQAMLVMPDTLGRTPLHYATLIVDFILTNVSAANRLKIYEVDKRGQTPLHRVMKHCDKDVLRPHIDYLKNYTTPAERQAILTKIDDKGRNCLHRAAKTGYRPLLDLITSSFEQAELAPLYCADKQGKTPLTYVLNTAWKPWMTERNDKGYCILALYKKAPFAEQISFLTTPTYETIYKWSGKESGEEVEEVAMLPLHSLTEYSHGYFYIDDFFNYTTPQARTALFAADNAGHNLLYHAASNGNTKMVKHLSKLASSEELTSLFLTPLEVEAATETAYTPFHAAIDSQKSLMVKCQVVKLLYQMGPTAQKVFWAAHAAGTIPAFFMPTGVTPTAIL